MNTATITITETTDQIKVEVHYDPLPTSGNASQAALVANKMVNMFASIQNKETFVSQTIYDDRTGETFTKETPVSKQAKDYNSTI